MRQAKGAAWAVLLLGVAAPAGAFPVIEGWTPVGEARSFGPQELWQEIDGGADLIAAYGFGELAVQDLRRDSVTVSVEIYDMVDRLGAYGLYTAERPRGVGSLPIGAESTILAPYLGLLLKGDRYVKVSQYEGTMEDEAFADLLRRIDAALPGEKELPPELDLLPTEGRVPGSIGFTRKGYLGLRELQNCIHAQYADEALGDWKTFVIAYTPMNMGEQLWRALRSRWRRPAGAGGALLVRRIPYGGLVGAVRTPYGIFGIAGIEEEETLVRRLRIIAETKTAEIRKTGSTKEKAEEEP